jgi:hypothetical protein
MRRPGSVAPSRADQAAGHSQALFLLPSDYDAAVEERWNTDVCGFPCCATPIDSAAPQTPARLLARKLALQQDPGLAHFCSAECATKSRALRDSVSSQPLHSREVVRAALREVFPEAHTLLVQAEAAKRAQEEEKGKAAAKAGGQSAEKQSDAGKERAAEKPKESDARGHEKRVRFVDSAPASATATGAAAAAASATATAPQAALAAAAAPASLEVKERPSNPAVAMATAPSAASAFAIEGYVPKAAKKKVARKSAVKPPASATAGAPRPVLGEVRERDPEAGRPPQTPATAQASNERSDADDDGEAAANLEQMLPPSAALLAALMSWWTEDAAVAAALPGAGRKPPAAEAKDTEPEPILMDPTGLERKAILRKHTRVAFESMRATLRLSETADGELQALVDALDLGRPLPGLSVAQWKLVTLVLLRLACRRAATLEAQFAAATRDGRVDALLREAESSREELATALGVVTGCDVDVESLALR